MTYAKSGYAKKLLDPRWQKRRLEILDRDNFTCRGCGAKDKTLHVHHAAYTKDEEPWETHAALLYTLCVDCHDAEHQAQKDSCISIRLLLGQLGIQSAHELNWLADLTCDANKDKRTALIEALASFEEHRARSAGIGMWF